MGKVELVDVQIAAAKFVGDILQTPPMVSAVKIGGQRLHELARQGIEVERQARPVTVFRYDVSSGPESNIYRIEVDCSSGTYVRTLAADVGEALGGGAHLQNLRRTAIGPFGIERARSLEELEADLPSNVLSAAEMVGHLECVTVNDEIELMVGHGKQLPEDVFAGSGPWAVLNARGDLLAVYEQGRSGPKAGVVLAAQ
jgi:tRNA pseudouridine55 synthase